MEKENIIKEKAYNFAVRIINLYKFLTTEKKEFIISKQILRSGTSIGANVEEAVGGISRRDFISKLSIAYKQSRETHYWFRLIHDGQFINEKMFIFFEIDCLQICKILISIIRSTRKSN
ncbi:MAG: four helix bundle protein [Ignavibacteria bacterium]|nr:four helix bundle protein [Ignavibacteria bacterium]